MAKTVQNTVKVHCEQPLGSVVAHSPMTSRCGRCLNARHNDDHLFGQRRPDDDGGLVGNRNLLNVAKTNFTVTWFSHH